MSFCTINDAYLFNLYNFSATSQAASSPSSVSRLTVDWIFPLFQRQTQPCRESPSAPRNTPVESRSDCRSVGCSSKSLKKLFLLFLFGSQRWQKKKLRSGDALNISIAHVRRGIEDSTAHAQRLFKGSTAHARRGLKGSTARPERLISLRRGTSKCYKDFS